MAELIFLDCMLAFLLGILLFERKILRPALEESDKEAFARLGNLEAAVRTMNRLPQGIEK